MFFFNVSYLCGALFDFITVFYGNHSSNKQYCNFSILKKKLLFCVFMFHIFIHLLFGQKAIFVEIPVCQSATLTNRGEKQAKK